MDRVYRGFKTEWMPSIEKEKEHEKHSEKERGY
jgi:hypothetical protein